MSTAPGLTPSEIEALRGQHYNAQLVEVLPVHEDLRIFRVRPDWGETTFHPGQYTTIGLGYWERRVAGVDAEELTPAQLSKVIKRAYSFSCPMLDSKGKLAPPSQGELLEFYITLVRHAEEHPPGLTPRLFGLKAGDRLHMGQKVTGHYTLTGVKPDDTVVFVATGTGEAPHNTMIAELLSQGHAGKLVAVACVRMRQDLGYLQTYRQLEARYAQLKYVVLTTREPENLDPSVPGYVGKRYLQDYFASGDLERESGIVLHPEHTHVFLCGNPAMIGAPRPHGEGAARYPQELGMVEVLERRGFHADEPRRPGNVHFEKYW
jgi:ferredoxin--NADP+ reductase